MQYRNPNVKLGAPDVDEYQHLTVDPEQVARMREIARQLSEE
jgi:hypothetical protein